MPSTSPESSDDVLPRSGKLADIRPMGEEDRATWNDFVLGAGGNLFHTWEWGALVERATGERMERLGAWEGERLVATGNYLSRRRGPWRLGVNPLLTPYAGILVAPSDKTKYRHLRHEERRRREAVLGAMKQRCSLIHLQTLGHDMRDYLGAGFRVAPRYTYCVDLDDIERLWVRLDGATRRQVQKSRRGSSESLAVGAAADEIASVVRSTFERRGSDCPISDAFVREIVDAPEFETRRLILAGRNDGGDLLSFVVALWDPTKTTAHYVLAGTRPEELQSGVSSWLVWETIKQLTASGVKVFDFCGANIDRIARFKEGFSPRLVTYFDIEWARSRWMRLARNAARTLRSGAAM